MCIFEELASVLVEAGKVQNLQGSSAGWRPVEELGVETKNGLMVEFIFPERSNLFS